MIEARARRRRRLAGLAAALAIAAAGIGAPRLHDLALAVEGGRLRVGAAYAQAPDTVTLENVALEFETVGFRFARAEISGTSLSRPELAALLDKAAAEGWAARLARVTARAITIPELVVEQRAGGRPTVVTYRDVVARDVVEGRIGSLTSSGASVDAAGQGGGSGRYGRLALQGFDLPQAVRLYTDRAGPEPAEMKRIYGAVSIEDVALDDPKGPQITIARLAGRDVRARLMPQTWAEAAGVLGAARDPDAAGESERSRRLGMLADLLGAFDVASAEITGLEVRDPASRDRAVGRVARLSYAGAAENRPAEARAEGVDVSAETGRARIAAMSFTGFSLISTFEGLRALGRKPAAELDAAGLRKLMPTIGTLRISGLEFEGPGETANGATPETIRFGVKDLEVTADKPINGIPTNLRLGVERFTFAIPEAAADPGLADLRAMGYAGLDLSWLVAASWNEPGNELLVREVSLAGAEMGAVTVGGVLGNVTRDVFNADAAIALVALVGATAKSIDLTIENKGLFERVLVQEARKQNRRPEEMRGEYGVAAAFGVPAMLGGSGSAKAIGQAVARFIARPGRLALSARTKDPAGLGIADAALASEPAALLDRLEVSASAE